MLKKARKIHKTNTYTYWSMQWHWRQVSDLLFCERKIQRKYEPVRPPFEPCTGGRAASIISHGLAMFRWPSAIS